MHTMELISDQKGTEEWLCPTCGRHVSITWEPWNRVILEPGDVYATHSGSRGGLSFESLQVTQSDSTSESELFAEDPYLSPWQKWVNNSNWAGLWDRED